MSAREWQPGDKADVNLTELRKVAEAATPGPWVHAGRVSIESEHECSSTHDCRGIASTSGLCRHDLADSYREAERADAAHIATFDPPTVLALLDEVERLRGWKASALEVLSEWDRVYEALGRPGRLGEAKSKGVLDRVAELEAKVARVEALAHRWETVPALRRGTCAADLRAALAGESDE